MGRELTLLTDQSEEQVQRIARYVDRKMRDLSLATRASDSILPVLTCYNLAEELFIASEENKILRRDLARLTEAQRSSREGDKH